MTAAVTARPAVPRTLARRLVPLQVAVGLQGLSLWVPVEKLFMTQIGFTVSPVGCSLEQIYLELTAHPNGGCS